MKRTAAGTVLIVVAVIAVVMLYLMFSGPRMRIQPKIVPQQGQLPDLPQGIVPVSAESSAIPAAQTAAQLRNPLPDTEHTRQTGRVYYGYYCAFCHGRTGRGDGPVGVSYTPSPTDLVLPPVQTLPDGAIYRAMLTGIGHEPVLGYVINPEQRWYIVSYVRHLQGGQTQDREAIAPR